MRQTVCVHVSLDLLVINAMFVSMVDMEKTARICVQLDVSRENVINKMGPVSVALVSQGTSVTTALWGILVNIVHRVQGDALMVGVTFLGVNVFAKKDSLAGHVIAALTENTAKLANSCVPMDVLVVHVLQMTGLAHVDQDLVAQSAKCVQQGSLV